MFVPVDPRLTPLSYLISPFIHHLTTQEKAADFAKCSKAAQREARRCDLPACQATAADLKLGERFKKCPACRTAIYCCKDHAVRHYPEHESLCKELTRICDYPECKERADIDIMCRQCKVATYCSKKHREKHSSAHEGQSRCEELRALRKVR